MADLAGLSYFQVDQLVNGLVPDTLDVGLDPDFYNVWMTLEITARIEGAPGMIALRLIDLTPPRTLVLTVTEARIETGVLRLPRDNAPAGETVPPTPTEIAAQQTSSGLRLLAHSSVLGIGDRRLLYDFQPGETKINGRTLRLPGFTIAAPHVEPAAYDTNNPPKVDLTTAPRVVDENPTFGTGRIAAIPDLASVDSQGRLVLSAAGVPLGPPLDIATALVLTVANFAALPQVGNPIKVYRTADTGASWVWSTSAQTYQPLAAALVPVVGEAPSGTKNGTNKAFTTQYPYRPNTIAVYLNGLRESNVAQTNATTITFSTAPLSSDEILVDYTKG